MAGRGTGPADILLRPGASVRRGSAPWHRDSRRRGRACARAVVGRRHVCRHGADERKDDHDRDAVRTRGEPHPPRLDRGRAECDRRRRRHSRHRRRKRYAGVRRAVRAPRRTRSGERPGLPRSARVPAGGCAARGRACPCTAGGRSCIGADSRRACGGADSRRAPTRRGARGTGCPPGTCGRGAFCAGCAGGSGRRIAHHCLERAGRAVAAGDHGRTRARPVSGARCGGPNTSRPSETAMDRVSAASMAIINALAIAGG